MSCTTAHHPELRHYFLPAQNVSISLCLHPLTLIYWCMEAPTKPTATDIQNVGLQHSTLLPTQMVSLIVSQEYITTQPVKL